MLNNYLTSCSFFVGGYQLFLIPSVKLSKLLLLKESKRTMEMILYVWSSVFCSLFLILISLWTYILHSTENVTLWFSTESSIQRMPLVLVRTQPCECFLFPTPISHTTPRAEGSPVPWCYLEQILFLLHCWNQGMTEFQPSKSKFFCFSSWGFSSLIYVCSSDFFSGMKVNYKQLIQN